MLVEPDPKVNLPDKLRQPVFEFLINFTIPHDFHTFLGDVDAPAGCWLQAAGWMPAAGCCLLAAARPLGRSAAQPLSRSAAQPLSRSVAQSLSRSVKQPAIPSQSPPPSYIYICIYIYIYIYRIYIVYASNEKPYGVTCEPVLRKTVAPTEQNPNRSRTETNWFV